jgi:cysteinyl-tRNA synthetase
MRLFDTLSRAVRDLQPGDGERFRFYCCGPTVYGPAHIGNFRTFVLQDVLRRSLEAGGMATFHVRNITDLDDKTIRDSQAAGQSLAEFTGYWTAKFHADCGKLGLLAPHVEPGAVAHIPQQLAMIERLLAKGHAYASEDGSVYFQISSFPGYGALSHLDERELALGQTQNARANADEYEKDSLSDFVLWKARRPGDGENFWPSPWGDGRPGWHLECSAMIAEYLGESFDLHGGGVDLVFPHHENEIAQSRCACGGSFAAHWFHCAHLMVDGGKMSKSLGNLYTLDDLEAKGWSAMEVRYVLISGHYRKPLNFTFDSLHAAREAIGKIARATRALRAKAPAAPAAPAVAPAGPFAGAWEALNDDLNTAGALGGIFLGLRAAAELPPAELPAALAALDQVLSALGLTLPDEPAAAEVPAEVRAFAEERWAARCARDWARADAMRAELLEMGWVVKDAKESYELSQA